MALEIASAKGNYLYDNTGKAYLDLIAGISVCNIGHQHPRVIAAIEEQLHKHLHVMVYGEVVQSKQSEYGQSLISILPESLNNVYFTNSGAEAIDAAMKLAKRVTGKFGFVAQTQAYHGSTQGPISLMSDAYFTDPYKPLLGSVYFINQNDTSSLANIPWKKIAGVVVEIIQAEKGTTQANVGFLAALRALCDEHCVLLIFDEIQTGFGRTGALFAFQQYQIVPDVLVLGKALGGGLPMGAMIAGKHLMQQFSYNPVLGHITTFGGHPVIAAAALAGINELERMKLMSFIPEKENLYRRNLIYPAIEKISGKELMLAVQLDSFENNLKVIQYCMEAGLITDWFLFANNKIRIAPPLTITNEEILHACSIIVESINKVYEKR